MFKLAVESAIQSHILAALSDVSETDVGKLYGMCVDDVCIITKDDLKEQVDIYDAEIEKLSVQITNNTNPTETHREQLEEIKHYLQK